MQKFFKSRYFIVLVAIAVSHPLYQASSAKGMLEEEFNQAFDETRDKQYEYITLEQVLYVVVCRYLASFPA